MPWFLSAKTIHCLVATCIMSSSALTLTGTVVPGVECPAIEQDNGQVVALSFLPAPYKIGDRITVSGSGFGGSMSCQQEVFLVESALPAK